MSAIRVLPDTQDNNGSATGLTIPRGLRLRVAVTGHRNPPLRVDAETDKPAEEGNIHQTPRKLTASWVGDKVADGEKDGLIFLSFIHDHLKGRKSEMEYIPGVVSRKGRELGIPTLFNDAVVEIDRRINVGEIKMNPSNLDLLKKMVGIKS